MLMWPLGPLAALGWGLLQGRNPSKADAASTLSVHISTFAEVLVASPIADMSCGQ